METLVRYIFPSENVEEMEIEELKERYEEAIFIIDLEINKMAEAIAKVLDGAQN